MKAQELVAQGFKVIEQRKDCTYMSRGADHRVVFVDGTVKRGQPAHRGAHR